MSNVFLGDDSREGGKLRERERGKKFHDQLGEEDRAFAPEELVKAAAEEGKSAAWMRSRLPGGREGAGMTTLLLSRPSRATRRKLVVLTVA